MKKADVKRVLENMVENYNTDVAYAAEKWFLWHEAGIDKGKNKQISSSYCAKYSELRIHINALAEVLGIRISEIDFQKEYTYPFDKNITGTLIYSILEIE